MVKNQSTTIKDFRTLMVWQKALDLNTEIYKIINDFPDFEKYNMISQITSASTSISANIAEGNGLGRFPEKEKFHLTVAMGSAKETLSWIITAKNAGYITEDRCKELSDLTEEVIKLLFGYYKYVSESSDKE